MGHQCLGAAFGASIVRATNLMHGKVSEILHDNSGVFKGIQNPFTATRYHSLVIEKESLAEDFIVNAWTTNETVMGIQHETLPLVGLQFHPELIATEKGIELLENYLKI